MTDAETIITSYQALRARLDMASGKKGVPEILPVTKTVPAERFTCLADVGVKSIGENRVQEALEKQAALDGAFDIQIIGRLQTNKAREAAKLASMIQSLDRWELALELEKAAGKLNRVLDVLVQVNIGRDPAKAGIMEEDAEEFLAGLREVGCLEE